MKKQLKNLKDYRIHTSLIEETIKDRVRKRRLFRSDVMVEGKRKERPVTDTPNQYEIKYLLGPHLSVVVKRLLPLEDLDRLNSLKVRKVSELRYYSQLISVGAGFDIDDGNIIDQHFSDSLTILNDANKIDTVVKFQFFYDNSAEITYSRNFNLELVEFIDASKKVRLGQYNPAYIFNLLFDMLQREKEARNYYLWRKGLGFGFNKQSI